MQSTQDMQSSATEILINAFQVTDQLKGDSYEFVLNEELKVIECVRIEPRPKSTLKPVKDVHINLEGLLFELNHVRVNPRMDNTSIIQRLTTAFQDIGVRVFNQPKQHDMKVCFKPLGELSDSIRFYICGTAKVIFLSPTKKPQLTCIKGIQ